MTLRKRLFLGAIALAATAVVRDLLKPISRLRVMRNVIVDEYTMYKIRRDGLVFLGYERAGNRMKVLAGEHPNHIHMDMHPRLMTGQH